MNGTDWTPGFSYLEPGQNEAKTSWGQPQSPDGNRHSHDSAALLCKAGLSIEEIEFITALRLDPERHSDEKCARFEELVSVLPRIMDHSILDVPGSVSRFRIEPGMRWIRELIAGFVPHRQELIDQLSEDPAAYFIAGNHGPALTILHLLMMRSDYWPLMFEGAADLSTAALADFWDMPSPEATFATLYTLAGDPFNLPARTKTGEWDQDTFIHRLGIFCEYVPVRVRPFLTDLDLLARVAASTRRRLKDYIMAYDEWYALS